MLFYFYKIYHFLKRILFRVLKMKTLEAHLLSKPQEHETPLNTLLILEI